MTLAWHKSESTRFINDEGYIQVQSDTMPKVTNVLSIRLVSYSMLLCGFKMSNYILVACNHSQYLYCIYDNFDDIT